MGLKVNKAINIEKLKPGTALWINGGDWSLEVLGDSMVKYKGHTLRFVMSLLDRGTNKTKVEGKIVQDMRIILSADDGRTVMSSPVREMSIIGEEYIWECWIDG